MLSIPFGGNAKAFDQQVELLLVEKMFVKERLVELEAKVDDLSQIHKCLVI